MKIYDLNWLDELYSGKSKYSYDKAKKLSKKGGRVKMQSLHLNELIVLNSQINQKTLKGHIMNISSHVTLKIFNFS